MAKSWLDKPFRPDKNRLFNPLKDQIPARAYFVRVDAVPADVIARELVPNEIVEHGPSADD